MSYHNDHSDDIRRWSNRKLIDRLRETANLESFSMSDMDVRSLMGVTTDRVRANDKLREATRLYRESWMNPVLDEIERRLIKPKRTAP